MKEHTHLPSQELYSIRTLVFQETEPQSNKYKQIIFTPEEFKRTAETIGKIIKKSTDESHIDIIEVTLSDEVYMLPDLPEINQ